MHEAGDEPTEAEMDEWYRMAARDPALGLGAQVRDRKIRRLIEALWKEREKGRAAAES